MSGNGLHARFAHYDGRRVGALLGKQTPQLNVVLYRKVLPPVKEFGE
jgi:hypothetical protein